MSDAIRRRLTVRGAVQGVFFRDSVRRLAAERGVAGSASNREDGAVEVVLEGSPKRVEELIAFCRLGPEYARVEAVDVADEEPEGLSGFRIS